MSQDKLSDKFARNRGEYGRFELVSPKLTKRPDLHAFCLLDSLCPGTVNIVESSEEGLLWLGVDMNQLSNVVTERQVIDLIRCGVMYDGWDTGLVMYR